jgi:hypothetical protein
MRFERYRSALFCTELGAVLVGIGAIAILAAPPPLHAGANADPVLVSRVEEDWQLVLNEPGTEVNSPQFHTVMSPRCHLLGPYAQVSWNYRELDDFAPGGLQVQAWDEEDSLAFVDAGVDTLSTDAETVTWTQRLHCHAGVLEFRVLNGHSSSWGDFGGDAMTVRLDREVPNLNQYSADVSRANSWITYGENRVDSLVIREVRRYKADGTLVARDTTPVVVYRYVETQDDAGDELP